MPAGTFGKIDWGAILFLTIMFLFKMEFQY